MMAQFKGMTLLSVQNKERKVCQLRTDYNNLNDLVKL